MHRNVLSLILTVVFLTGGGQALADNQNGKEPATRLDPKMLKVKPPKTLSKEQANTGMNSNKSGAKKIIAKEKVGKGMNSNKNKPTRKSLRASDLKVKPKKETVPSTFEKEGA